MGRTIVRAFTEDGYHRDILVVSSEQVHSHDTRVDEPKLIGPFVGPGMSINPSEFPEMVRFEVLVEMDR